MAEAKVDSILARVQALPALPAVVYHLLRLVESPTATATDLSKVISKDQALTARILKLMNSSFYALRCKAVKVSHAIALLGFAAIKNLALGLSVLEMFDRQGGEADFDCTAFWEHSLCCATGARALAERTGYALAEEAFVAGLLHDIGKLVLYEYFRAEFKAALRAAREDAVPLRRAERGLFGMDHARVGALLAEHWRLPGQLRAAIGSHHEYTEGDRLSTLVYISNVCTKVKQIGSGGDDLLSPIDARCWSALDLDDLNLLRVMGSLRRDMDHARAFLGVGGGPRSARFDELESDAVGIGEPEATRVLVVEETESPINLAELVLLDHGYTTSRTSYPFNPAGAVQADLVLLDCPNATPEQTRSRPLEIGTHRIPVALLPSPRCASDVLETVKAALNKTPV